MLHLQRQKLEKQFPKSCLSHSSFYVSSSKLCKDIKVKNNKDGKQKKKVFKKIYKLPNTVGLCSHSV